MLNTLLKIGEWQSQGKDEWNRFLDYPKVNYEDKKGNKITNLTLSIIFDLDEMEVIIDKENIKEYDKSDVPRLKAVKVKGGNNKANYVTVPASKLVQLYKTFYGKEGSEAAISEMVESINKTDPFLLTDKLKAILDLIHQLKDNFLEKISPEKQDKITSKPLESRLELTRTENLVLVTTQVKSDKHGFSKPTYFTDIPDFATVINCQYFGKLDAEKQNSPGEKRLCYANGEVAEDVSLMDLKRRDSLNKMFGAKTYCNYISNFNKDSAFKNYQVSEHNKAFLDVASAYLLESQRIFTIAGVKHCLIPEFLNYDNVDIGMALSHVTLNCEILFSLKLLDEVSKDIEPWTKNIFWINLIALEVPVDKKYLKTYNTIKDISIFHFNKVLKEFVEIDWELKEMALLDWDNIMLEYDYDSKQLVRRNFNFLTIYKIIPIRKDKEKRNKALELFKSVLENRKVRAEELYDYFTELSLCHWFERYGSYTNIPKSTKDYFHISVKKSVFKYLAFIQVLKKLNLIEMEESNTKTPAETGKRYDDAIQVFFDKMNITNDQQRAMFYLGRILNRVEWIQIEKKIKKTVIHLVNFNGLDKDHIERLYEDLFSKAKQHSRVGDIKFISGQFHSYFKYTDWKMNSKEALFFLLSGYSFQVKKDEAEKQLTVESGQ